MRRTSTKTIAVLLPSMHVGGAERLVLEEISFLKDDPRFSIQVHLVFDEGPFYKDLVSLGLPVHVWGAPHKSVRMLKTYADIIKYLRRMHCDITHSHLLDGIGPIIGRLAGTRVVATVHNDVRYNAIERYVLGRSNLVLGCGEKVLENIRNFIPAEKVGVLKNAIRKPDKVFLEPNEVRSRFEIKEGSKLVVSIGRLTRQKGFDTLIQAFRRVVASVPDAVLLIGGEGEEREKLIDMVQSPGLLECIKLPGLVRNVNEVLAACDLYVNSSRYEGLPMTLLESIAHGKPMVATIVGGNSEVVRDGSTGILVPPEDPEKLAEAIIRMLKDDDFRTQAGRAASKLFFQEYTIDKHCETLAQCYLKVTQDVD